MLKKNSLKIEDVGNDSKDLEKWNTELTESEIKEPEKIPYQNGAKLTSRSYAETSTKTKLATKSFECNSKKASKGIFDLKKSTQDRLVDRKRSQSDILYREKQGSLILGKSDGRPQTAIPSLVSLSRTGKVLKDHKDLSSKNLRPSLLPTIKRQSDKNSLENQLATMKKNFNYDKKKLLESQTRILEQYKSIEALEEKLNPGQNDRKSEMLKLVAYEPVNNNCYVCKDSGGKYAIWAENRRVSTIANLKNALTEICNEMRRCGKVGFIMSQQLLDRSQTLLTQIKKIRTYDQELFIKKMKLSFKETEQEINLVEKEEYINIDKFISRMYALVSAEENKMINLTEFSPADGNTDSIFDHQLKTKLTAKDKEIEELKAMLKISRKIGQKNDDASQTYLDEAKVEISSDGSTTGPNTDSTDDSPLRCRTFEKQIQCLETKIENINKENKDLSVTAANACQQLILKNGELDTKMMEIKELIIENESLKNENKTKLTRLYKLMNEAKDLKDRIKEFENLTVVPGDVPAELRTLRETHLAATSEIKILKKELRKMRIDLQRQKEMIGMYEKLLHIRSELIQNLQEKDDTNRRQMDELRSVIKEGTNQIEKMKTLLTAKDRTWEDVLSTVDFKENEFSNIKANNSAQYKIQTEHGKLLAQLDRKFPVEGKCWENY